MTYKRIKEIVKEQTNENIDAKKLVKTMLKEEDRLSIACIKYIEFYSANGGKFTGIGFALKNEDGYNFTTSSKNYLIKNFVI